MAAERESSTRTRWVRKIYAVPADHGAWALWLGPLAVGIGVGGWNGLPSLLLVGAQLSAFLARQPLLILAKAGSGRRSRGDVGPALIWAGGYGLLGILAGTILVVSGYPRLLWVVVPVTPMLLWQAWLIRKHAERQLAIELAGAGTLALAAPTASYVATGALDAAAFGLWILCWAQASAAIVYVYVRLIQRRLARLPPRPERWRIGRRAVAHAGVNLLGSSALAMAGVVPPLTPVGFAAMLAQAVHGTLRPCAGAKPRQIGFAQVGATAIFVVLLIGAYRL